MRWHGEPARSREGEASDNVLQRRVVGKMVAEVTGRTEKVGKVEPTVVLGVGVPCLSHFRFLYRGLGFRLLLLCLPLVGGASSC